VRVRALPIVIGFPCFGDLECQSCPCTRFPFLKEPTKIHVRLSSSNALMIKKQSKKQCHSSTGTT